MRETPTADPPPIEVAKVMTNESRLFRTERVRGPAGRRARSLGFGPRSGSGPGWGWTAVAAALAVLAWSVPAEAARVLDLRVGRHAEFTRVVVELDTPAGYKVEHHEPRPGVSELVVSLEASGAAKRIAGAKERIQSVTLEPVGPGRSLIRIRLAREGLRLKEMILAGPPRIVLDILGGEPETRTAAATPSAPKARPKPPPPEPEATPEPEPEPEPAAETAEASPSPSGAEPTAPAEAAAARAGEEPSEVEGAEAKLAGAESAEPAESGMAASEGEGEEMEPGQEVAGTDEGAFDEFGVEAEEEPAQVAMGGRQEAAAPPTTPPTPAARPVTPTPARRSAPAEDGSLFSTDNLALGAGAVLLLAGGLFIARRRSKARSQREAAESDALGEDNPFAGLGEGESGEEGEQSRAAAAVSQTAALFESGSDAAQGSDEPSLFDAVADEKEIEGVEMETASSGIDLGAAPAAGGNDIMRLVRELERRVTSLETRLDEAVDAKERLERQVAAQTEELRVQRAAIARTQRAVRNLTRPDEDGATEPAPREG